jgi:very-short-patch-repair endonuclease
MDLTQTLAAQDGLITRAQALSCGMTDAALQHAAGPGRRWQRLRPGIYAAFTGPLSDRQRLRAALLHAGPDAVLSGADACTAAGLRYVPSNQPITVLVPNSRQIISLAGVRILRVRRAPRVRYVSGLPMAQIERAVLDVCACLTSLRDVRALACECVQRNRTTPERLNAALREFPRRGSRLARRAIADLLLGCRSAPECELNDLVARSHILPAPELNRELTDVLGVTPDACWPRARLIVEVDSVEHHQLGVAPEHTQRRHARLAALGWVVLPISPRRIREDPDGVLREIEAAYLACLARAA